jgi:AraC-like DNA-binding protein
VAFLDHSLDMPANSAVSEASKQRPCLGLTLKLDLRTLAELIAQAKHPPPRDGIVRKSAGIGTLTPTLVAPLGRLVALMDEPDAIPLLAPLIKREIHYRLLMSDQAGLLRQIVSVDSHGHRVAKAIDWLKLNYDAPLRVEELAARIGMSPRTFHHHFRQLTALSPLQYQKWMRLNEARRLMLSEQLDAASAAFRVGYESARSLAGNTVGCSAHLRNVISQAFVARLTI